MGRRLAVTRQYSCRSSPTIQVQFSRTEVSQSLKRTKLTVRQARQPHFPKRCTATFINSISSMAYYVTLIFYESSCLTRHVRTLWIVSFAIRSVKWNIPPTPDVPDDHGSSVRHLGCPRPFLNPDICAWANRGPVIESNISIVLFFYHMP